VLLRVRVVAVPRVDHGVEEVLERSPRFLVASSATHTKVGNQAAGLHRVGKRVALAGLGILELRPEFGSAELGHGRLVLVGELGALVEARVVEVIAVLHVHTSGELRAGRSDVVRDESIAVLALLDAGLGTHISRAGTASKHLFELDDLGHAIDHLLHELHLGVTETLLVGHVELGILGGGVLASRATGLKIELGTNLFEKFLVHMGGIRVFEDLVEALELDHHGRTKASAEVRRARAEETEAGSPHQFSTVLGGGCLEGLRQSAEHREHRWNITAHVHGYDTAVVFLVAPREGGLVLVVEDTAVVGPVTGSTSTHEEVAGGGDLEQVTLAEEEVAIRVGHVAKLVVGALKIATKTSECLLEHSLHPCALVSCRATWQRKA